MAACAQNLTPCVVECGGKDAMVVAADADLDQPPSRPSGARCQRRPDLRRGGAGLRRGAGLERVLSTWKRARRAGAHRPGARRRLRGDHHARPARGDRRPHRRRARGRRPGAGRRTGLGARAVRRAGGAGRRPGRSPAVTEETFGPTLVIGRVADLDEAVRRPTRRLRPGCLGVQPPARAAIARQLHAGMVSVNSVLTYASMPGLPWGGSGDSGFGRIHGPDGLREFARSRAITASGSRSRSSGHFRPSEQGHRPAPAAGQAALGTRLSRRCDQGDIEPRIGTSGPASTVQSETRHLSDAPGSRRS